MSGRPFVSLNMAMTADGKITSATREYPEFTSAEDRLTMDRLRAEADVLVVGAGTLRSDDPPMHVRDAEMREVRRLSGKSDVLPVVVVSSSLAFDLGAGWFQRGSRTDRWIATVEDADPAKVDRLRDRVQVLTCGRGRVDLAALLQRFAEFGWQRVLLEGGGELNWEFVRAGLLDALHVTIAPVLLGGRDAPTLLEGSGFRMAERSRLRLTDVRRIDDELFLRWEVVR